MIPCDECHEQSDTVAVQFTFEGDRKTQCRKCYEKMRQREIAQEMKELPAR